MSLRLRPVARAVLLMLVSSCAQLECDQQKQDSMEANNRGVQKAKNGSVSDAIKDFELALQQDKTNHEAAWNLGQLYMNQAQAKCDAHRDADCTALWDKASAAFEVAAKNNPDDAMYHYRLGQAYMEAGKLDQGLTSLTQAIKLNAKLFKAHFYLGRIHFAQGRPREAALAWNESARLNPGFGKPFISLGQLYYTWDFFAEAAKVLEQGAATARDPADRAAINYQLGLSYDALAQFDKAIAAYEASMKDDPGNVDAKLQIGMTFANKGDVKNGKKWLDDYVKSVGSSDKANAFKVMAANARLFKLLQESAP